MLNFAKKQRQNGNALSMEPNVRQPDSQQSGDTEAVMPVAEGDGCISLVPRIHGAPLMTC